MTEPILQCINVGKHYEDAGGKLTVLRQVNLSVQPQDTLAIVGPSGSGKSTLLQLLGGLESPSHGQVQLMGQDWQMMTERERCLNRSHHVGFVYQFHHLLPEFTALENVMLPLWIAGQPRQKCVAPAETMLQRVGLVNRCQHKPGALSGGERQRVAIARAVVTHPKVILADEPTGNLDEATAAQVMTLIDDLNRSLGMAWVVVTHDTTMAQGLTRCLRLQRQALV